MQRHRGGLFALCCATLLLLTAPALAETIKIVVPFAAGGPVDQLARILANGLGPKLNANVIVDDRGGAGGAIASEYVAHAAPDGKTILLASLGSQVLSPILKPPTSYDPVKSFEPVMLVGRRAVPARGQQGPRRCLVAATHQQGEGAEAHLWLGGPGHDHEHRGRNAQRRGRRKNHARALSRRRAGDQRSARRPCRHAQCRSAGPAAAGQSRLGQGARFVRRGALAAVAGFADNRRARPAERGDGKLVRRAVARRDAERRA